VPEPLRVLVAGWLNSPHVAAWAEAVTASGHEVELAGRVGPQWPELDLPVPSHRLPAHLPPPLRGLHMSRELGRVAAAYRPDLVHAHYLPEYGWMAAREGLTPLVCSAWGSDVLGAGRIARLRSRRALEAAAVVFVDSAHLAREVRTLAGRDVRVEVVRWGLDLERFAPGDARSARDALGLDGDGPLVAGVRGLRPVYNPQLLLEAFALVRRHRPEARLLLKHPLDSTPPFVGEAVEQLGLADAVTVLGSIPAEQLPDVYRAADVVVSIPSSDSSPRSVWEALACGRPVIVSDLPWARDELESGGRALLAPLRAEAVAEAIRRVLDDEALARRLAQEGRSLAIAELDPAACAARIDALYRSVAQAPG
jgi:glycosyltransferase involved in cell wall biosynthesis